MLGGLQLGQKIERLSLGVRSGDCGATTKPDKCQEQRRKTMAKPMTKTEWMNWLEKAWDEAQQRESAGLTDEEIDTAWRSVDYTVSYEQFRIDIARAIEAKLKEKNHG